MIRRHHILVTLALIPLIVGWIVITDFSRADDAAPTENENDTGTIQGTISVEGVRSPENVLVYIEEVPGEWPPPEEPAEVDQVELSFVPHVLPVVKGTTVKFLNSDPILHNIFWQRNGSYSARNLGTWGKGSSKTYKFDELGEVVLLCNVHPEMEGHVVVLQNPFFAVVGEEGTYEIKDVPPGEYTVTTWYSNPRKLRSQSSEVTVAAGESAEVDFSLSRRGR